MNVQHTDARLRDANPIPDPAQLHQPSMEADDLLLAIKHRSGMVKGEPRQLHGGSPPPPQRRGVLVAVGAFVMVLVLVGAIALTVSWGGDRDAVPPATATSGVTTTVADINSGQDRQEALDITDRFFTAYNSGDVDQILALMAPDADVESTAASDLTGLRAELIWNTAQKTQFGQVDCTAAQATSRDLLGHGELSAEPTTDIDAIRVRCRYTYAPLLYQAADRAGEGEATLVVANNQVIFFGDWLVPATYIPFLEGFRAWLEDEHGGDVADVFIAGGIGPVLSLESAELRNRYANDYAATLKEQ